MVQYWLFVVSVPFYFGSGGRFRELHVLGKTTPLSYASSFKCLSSKRGALFLGPLQSSLAYKPLWVGSPHLPAFLFLSSTPWVGRSPSAASTLRSSLLHEYPPFLPVLSPQCPPCRPRGPHLSLFLISGMLKTSL